MTTILNRSNRSTGSTEEGWYYIDYTPAVSDDGSWVADLVEDCCPHLDGHAQSCYIVAGNFPTGFRHRHISKDAAGMIHSDDDISDMMLRQLADIVETEIARSKWIIPVRGGRLTGGKEPRNQK